MGYSNYPPGAEHDPSAPYNQVEPEEREFECEVFVSLSRKDCIVSTEYDHIVECEEDGYYEEFDTSNINWEETWKRETLTPIQLFDILKEFAEEKLATEQDIRQRSRLKDIIYACKDWTMDELEVNGLS